MVKIHIISKIYPNIKKLKPNNTMEFMLLIKLINP